MPYRVCIPTAGTGSRLEALTKWVNKSLVSVANRPALSHIIDQFPTDTEFVVALGHKGQLVREFVELAYPERRFYFSNVDPFEGPGSGLGRSLLSCKQYLQEPFIFVSCDTLVGESIPGPEENWMGYAEDSETQSYRTLKVRSGIVEAISEKGEGRSEEDKAYIGLAGIYNYQDFWDAMLQGEDRTVEVGEVHGMRRLLAHQIRALQFSWYDIGNIAALHRTREIYQQPGGPNILEKSDEAIWFVENHVIKFSHDEKFIDHRVRRAQLLKGFVPEVTGTKPHMYRYGKVKGQVVSEIITLPLCERLLNYCRDFWRPVALNSIETQEFHDSCMRFYEHKTRERVARFYSAFSRLDGKETINGVPKPLLAELLDKLDWNWLADGRPGRFHGDFHFENILWSEDQQRFIFLDWRQDFGGSLTTGDIYYDLAKLLHGLIITHELIAQNHFWIRWEHEEICYDFLRKHVLVECERYFHQWLEFEGFDCRKVRILAALIFLNIAALHHHPYSSLLFALGKTMLAQELES